MWRLNLFLALKDASQEYVAPVPDEPVRLHVRRDRDFASGPFRIFDGNP